MKNAVVFILLSIVLGSVYSQQTNSNTDTILFLGASVDKAKYDISRGVICLYLPGGFAGSERYETDSIAERMYKFYYISYGCTGGSRDSYTEYNKVVFEYLDKMYGDVWRRDVRLDVIGLNK